jgi:Cu2+-exporting ATPase
VDVATDGSGCNDEAVRIAAAVKRDSEHTIAQGIVKTAEERGLSAPRAGQFEATPGHGVRALVDGKEFYVGGPAMLLRLAVTPAAAVRERTVRAATRGQVSVYLLASSSAVAAFAIADAVRPESQEAIKRLHHQQIEVVMLTGDPKAVAESVATDIGIDSVFAEVLPPGRVNKDQRAKKRGETRGHGG